MGAVALKKYFMNKILPSMRLTSLIDCCVTFFKKNLYTQYSIQDYECLWRVGICSYMSRHDIEIYSPDIGLQFIKEDVLRGREADELSMHELGKIRSIRILDDFLLLGYIRKRVRTVAQYTFEGPIGLQMQNFLLHLQNSRRSKLTIRYYEQRLNHFLKYLDENAITSVNKIKEKHV